MMHYYIQSEVKHGKSCLSVTTGCDSPKEALNAYVSLLRSHCRNILRHPPEDITSLEISTTISKDSASEE